MTKLIELTMRECYSESFYTILISLNIMWRMLDHFRLRADPMCEYDLQSGYEKFSSRVVLVLTGFTTRDN